MAKPKVEIKDGPYTWLISPGWGEIAYKGEVISIGEFDRDASTFWMRHPSWGGDKAFDTGKEVIAYFKKNRITTGETFESVTIFKNKKNLEKLKTIVEHIVRKTIQKRRLNK